MTCNAATYRIGDIRGKNDQHLGPKFRIWGSPGGTAPKRGEDQSRTDMYYHARFYFGVRLICSMYAYHHAKFHADRCHRRRDVCNRTERNTSNLVPYHTNVWRVMKSFCSAPKSQHGLHTPNTSKYYNDIRDKHSIFDLDLIRIKPIKPKSKIECLSMCCVLFISTCKLLTS